MPGYSILQPDSCALAGVVFIIIIIIYNLSVCLDDGYRQMLVALSMHRGILESRVVANNTAAFQSVAEKTLSHYISAIHLMRDQLIATSSNYDLYSMAVGIAAVWLVSESGKIALDFIPIHLKSHCHSTTPNFSI